MTKQTKEEKSWMGQDSGPQPDFGTGREGPPPDAGREEKPADPPGEEDLRTRLEGAEKRAAENYDRYVRMVAEFENYKKRTAREKTEAIQYGNEALLRDILPLMDSIDRAMAHACASDDFDAFRKGLEMLRQQLACCLDKYGVEQIEALGKDFDPNVHDAMMQVDSGEHEQNKVVGEFEKGYRLKGRLLRPTRVSVCRRSGGEDAKNC